MSNSDHASSGSAQHAQGGGGEKKRWRGGKKRRRRRGGAGSGPGGGGNGGNNGGGGAGPEFKVEVDQESYEAVCGVLDPSKSGRDGWLRHAKNNYLPSEEPTNFKDIYVPPNLMRDFKLMEGNEVRGQAGWPLKGQQRLTLATVEQVDMLPPDEAAKRNYFKDLTVVDPEPQFVLEPGDGDVSLRIIDLLCPVGKGQRGLIVAPPRSGKTVLMQKVATALSARYPDVYIIVLLIDERPEEATGWRRSVTGENREVLVSTLDEGPKNHIAVAEMAMRRAQRMVEVGKDVVILLDSITRLTRAYNSHLGGRGGATMSGGIGAKVIEQPKRFFGAARNCEEGGSLTILATTLVDTGSRMDQVIFEEFKGTGNMELVLNRQLAEQRIFPAIDIELSGTRKEELLLGPSIVSRVFTLRRVLGRMQSLDAMPLLIDRLEKTASNADFLASFQTDD